MKKETKVMIAGGAGLFAVLALIGLRKLFAWKRRQYDEYYADFHQHFGKNLQNEDHHGVEILMMK
jgi:hypothetical protein